MLLDGYDMSQIKIYGQFSYDRSSQRELQFQTDIREIDLRRRVWHGEESEWVVCWVGFIALYCSSTYGVEILLTRSFTPFLVTVYVPSGLLVIISSVPDD